MDVGARRHRYGSAWNEPDEAAKAPVAGNRPGLTRAHTATPRPTSKAGRRSSRTSAPCRSPWRRAHHRRGHGLPTSTTATCVSDGSCTAPTARWYSKAWTTGTARRCARADRLLLRTSPDPGPIGPRNNRSSRSSDPASGGGALLAACGERRGPGSRPRTDGSSSSTSAGRVHAPLGGRRSHTAADCTAILSSRGATSSHVSSATTRPIRRQKLRPAPLPLAGLLPGVQVPWASGTPWPPSPLRRCRCGRARGRTSAA